MLMINENESVKHNFEILKAKYKESQNLIQHLNKKIELLEEDLKKKNDVIGESLEEMDVSEEVLIDAAVEESLRIILLWSWNPYLLLAISPQESQKKSLKDL